MNDEDGIIIMPNLEIHESQNHIELEKLNNEIGNSVYINKDYFYVNKYPKIE